MTPAPPRPNDGPQPATNGVTRRRATAALVVAVCLVAANMRASITSVGPLLEQIGADTGVAATTLGLLTAVPLAIWAAVSPIAGSLGRRFGMSRVVLCSLGLLALGTVIRSLPGQLVGLWIGTAIIGASLAVMNVLMPAVIKRDFPTRVALLMGAYTALIGTTGALSSGLAVPLSHLGDESSGWRIALFITGAALLPAAAIAWAWATRGHHQTHRSSQRKADRHHKRIWTDPVAWTIAGYMGFQSSVFFMMLTWSASIATSVGRTEAGAGVDVMVYQLVSIPGSMLLPLVLRGNLARFVPALIPVVGATGIVGLMLAPDAITLWMVIIGLSSGAPLGMALTLMAERARDHNSSAALSGMAQSVGYLMASIGPVLFGWLSATTGGWMAPLTLVLVSLTGQAVTGILAGRDKPVFAT